MEKVIILALLCCVGIHAESCTERVKKLESQRPLLGAFKPQCQPNGKYKEMQYHENSYFCVFPDTGEEILGTRRVGKKPKSCKLTKCMEQRHNVMKSKLIGAFVPQCEEDGSYKTFQCHGSTGYCFCVFPKTGEKVLGTESRFTRQNSCKITKCMEERHNVLKADPPLLGAFRPECEADGSYKKVQCHGSTGYCYCVFPETGEKVLGTELRFKKPQSCEITECVRERHTVLKRQPQLLGVFIPACAADGSYKNVQCQAGFCYCVFPETGKEILGTRLSVRGQRPKSCEQTACVMQRHEYLGAPKSGKFKPECNADGSFKNVQCNAGYCYCVFPSTGKEVLGTMAEKKGVRPTSCELTPCVIKRHKGWKQAEWGFLGVPIARCDANGKYSKVQCRKGMCWCVDPDTGKSLVGSAPQWTIPKC